MTNSNNNFETNRIGFHYFQDTLHYSSKDLSNLLPRLSQLSASWVVLLSESSRAIPENFISGLIDAGINPIIHFKLQLPEAPSAVELRPILSAYAKWGVKYVVLFDKPNESSSWSAAGWSHQDLVDRFIDRFLPLALEAHRIGLTPVFPPLMPGGSYWDTSFFKSSIQSLQRREQQSLLENMAVGIYAYTFGHELSWGQGGPAKWPQSKPYLTPSDSQDQRGFNNYQWISAIASSAGLKNIPIMQFGTGIKSPEMAYSPEVHAEIVQSMINLIDQSDDIDSPNKIMVTNFWLLSAEPDSEDYPQAWFKSGSHTLPIVRVLTPGVRKIIPQSVTQEPVFRSDPKIQATESNHSIDHYLLLATYEWGISEWHLDVIRAFVLAHKPTVGFSTKEAAMAKKVTVIGSEDFPPGDIQMLRDHGCLVDQIDGDGTSIATQLMER